MFTWLNTAGELRSERTRVCSPRKGRCVCVRHRGEHAAVRPAPRGRPTGIRGRGPVAQSSPHQACQGALCGSVSNSRAAMCETVNGLCPSLRKGPCRVNPARNPDGRREPGLSPESHVSLFHADCGPPVGGPGLSAVHRRGRRPCSRGCAPPAGRPATPRVLSSVERASHLPDGSRRCAEQDAETSSQPSASDALDQAQKIQSQTNRSGYDEKGRQSGGRGAGVGSPSVWGAVRWEARL